MLLSKIVVRCASCKFGVIDSTVESDEDGYGGGEGGDVMRTIYHDFTTIWWRDCLVMDAIYMMESGIVRSWDIRAAGSATWRWHW